MTPKDRALTASTPGTDPGRGLHRGRFGAAQVLLALGAMTGVAQAQSPASPTTSTTSTTSTTAPAPLAGADSAPARANTSAAPSKELLQTAAQHYNRGLDLYESTEYELAAIEFDRAYSLVPSYRVLYNVGQVRIQLSDYARARAALERYLLEGGDKLDPARRTLVERDLQMLALRTGTIRVESNADGAEIRVDDVPVGVVPLSEPLLLDAGAHHIVVRKPGFSAADTHMTLVGGDAFITRLDLAEEKATPSLNLAPPPPIVVEKHFVEKTDRSAWIWGTWSATGVFAVGAAVVGGFGLKAADELEQLRGDPDATRGRLDSAERRSRTLLVTSDVLAGAAIVSGGVALVLTLTHRKERAAAALASHRQLALAAGSRWVGVKGAF